MWTTHHKYHCKNVDRYTRGSRFVDAFPTTVGERQKKKLNKNVSRNKQETAVMADLNIASVGVIY